MAIIIDEYGNETYFHTGVKMAKPIVYTYPFDDVPDGEYSLYSPYSNASGLICRSVVIGKNQHNDVMVVYTPCAGFPPRMPGYLSRIDEHSTLVPKEKE